MESSLAAPAPAPTAASPYELSNGAQMDGSFFSALFAGPAGHGSAASANEANASASPALACPAGQASQSQSRGDLDEALTKQFTREVTSWTDKMPALIKAVHSVLGTRITPLHHQRQVAVRLAAVDNKRSYALVAHGPGTGKTVTALLCWAAFCKQRLNESPATLVVCVPPTLITQWHQEALAYLNIPQHKICVIATMEELKSLWHWDKATVTIVSATILNDAMAPVREAEAAKTPPPPVPAFIDAIQDAYLVYDESHSTRPAAYGTSVPVAFHTLRVMVKRATFTLFLTGTPVVNGLMDLRAYPLAFSLRVGAPDKKDNEWYASPETWADEKLEATVTSFTKSYADVVEEDLNDLPPIEIKKVPYVATFASRTDAQLYNRVIHAPIVNEGKLLDNCSRAQLALVAPRMMQVYVRDYDASAADLPGLIAADPPGPALEHLLRTMHAKREEGHHRILIMGHSVCALHIAMRRFVKDPRTSSLGVKIYEGKNKNPQTLKWFLESSPQDRVLLVSIESGGEGLHIVPDTDCKQRACRLVIFWTIPWTGARLKQAYKRIHRRGQTEKCEVLILVAEGSIDASLYALCLEKEQKCDSIMRGTPLTLVEAESKRVADGMERFRLSGDGPFPLTVERSGKRARD